MNNVEMRVLVVAAVCMMWLPAWCAENSPAEALRERLLSFGRSSSFAYAWSTSGTEWLRTNGFDRIRDASGGATPLFYFAEFRDIGGTWYPKSRYDDLRKAFASHARREFSEHGSIPMVTWHIQNPDIPPRWTSKKYGDNMGMRYFYWAEGYPMEHRYVLREIAEGSGSLCGTGRIDGVNARAFPNPRAWWEWCLRDVAAFCRTLTGPNGERIPIVFRPFHECDGDWFWWGTGSATPADYIAAFRFTVEVLRRELGSENVLFCYSPDRTWRDLGEVGKSGYLARYPGDDYVDLIGLDDYSIGQADATGSSEATTAEAVRRLRLLSSEAERRGKICGVYETGALNAVDDFYSVLYRVMTAPGVKCAMITTYDGQWTFPKTEAGRADMKRFFTLPGVLVDRR